MTIILSFITINSTRLQYDLIDGLNVQEESLGPAGSDSDDCVFVGVITPEPEVM